MYSILDFEDPDAEPADGPESEDADEDEDTDREDAALNPSRSNTASSHGTGHSRSVHASASAPDPLILATSSPPRPRPRLRRIRRSPLIRCVDILTDISRGFKVAAVYSLARCCCLGLSLYLRNAFPICISSMHRLPQGARCAQSRRIHAQCHRMRLTCRHEGVSH